MVGDGEVEAVARAIWDGMVSDTPPDAATLELEGYFDGARAAIAALDRVRSRPADGPEGEDHEAEVDRLANDLAEDWRKRAERAEADVTMWKTRLVQETARLRELLREARASSPVSDTEPDTAKLVEALREIATRPTMERNPDGDDQAAWTMQMIAREALAGFSVDAGNPESEDYEAATTYQDALAAACGTEADGPPPGWNRPSPAGNPRPEQPAPDRLGGQPPAEPEEGR